MIIKHKASILKAEEEGVQEKDKTSPNFYKYMYTYPNKNET